MYNSNWLSELYRLLLWLGAGAIVGWLTGLGAWVMLVAVTAYALNLLWQVRRLQIWLAGDFAAEPPEAGGLWGAVFDELYRRQQRSRRERERLHGLVTYLRESFTSLPYGAVMIDPDGDIEWSNRAAEELLGLRYPEDSGQQLVNLLRSPEFIAWFETEEDHAPLELASPYRRGGYLQMHVTFFGRRSRLLFIRDITQTQKLEQMRKDFVANVSHELRTPLTVINGYLETFAESLGEGNPRWRRALDQMLAQSRRMQVLIRDLLLLSRLETLPNASEHEALALGPLLQSIREEALTAADDERHILIECDDSLLLVGQREELRSAFSNLVFNAVRYTRPGGHVWLRWFAAGEQACLQVEDDGVGIEAEHLPRLTERFYRVDASRSMDTGGTGLGLAIAKHVLLRHDAMLDISSQPGRGSCFTCRFPLAATRPAQVSSAG
jgi:two-component system phosphate regulon sensor histidine kinase PhoR